MHSIPGKDVGVLVLINFQNEAVKVLSCKKGSKCIRLLPVGSADHYESTVIVLVVCANSWLALAHRFG